MLSCDILHICRVGLVVTTPFKYHPSIHRFLHALVSYGSMLTCKILIPELGAVLVVTATFEYHPSIHYFLYITLQGQKSNVVL